MINDEKNRFEHTHTILYTNYTTLHIQFIHCKIIVFAARTVDTLTLGAPVLTSAAIR